MYKLLPHEIHLLQLLLSYHKYPLLATENPYSRLPGRAAVLSFRAGLSMAAIEVESHVNVEYTDITGRVRQKHFTTWYPAPYDN